MSTYLFLHGFTGAPESWDPIVDRLGPARVLRPTLAGHGASPARPSDWSDEVERLLGVMDAHRVERAHVVGYSLGGRLAWGLLERAPERFTAATLVGAHPGLATARERDARRASDAGWARLLREEGLERFVATWEALPLWASQRSLPASVLDAQRRVRLGHDARALAATIDALGLAQMPPVSPERIDTPVELVVGELDTKHAGLAGALAPRLARGRRSVVSGVGHNVLLERPDALASILRAQEAA